MMPCRCCWQWLVFPQGGKGVRISTMIISLIAAISGNRVIGREGRIPWDLPADLQRFKALTMGHPLIMGRKTFESIGRPLPGRQTIILTRERDYRVAGCKVAHDLPAALAACGDALEAFVCGGEEVYRQALAVADRIYLTVIQGEVAGDAYFPAIPADRFALVAEEALPDAESAKFMLYQRPELGGTVRAILFDYGGVLAEEGFREALYVLARRQGLDPLQLHAAGMEAVYDSGYVVGRGSEADFWAMLRARTGLRGENAELSGEILSRFVLRPGMLELVRCLRRQGYRTAILSDQTDWLERLDRRDRFFHEFDQVFSSYRLGRGKRDLALFDEVVGRLGLAPHETLFVDDLPANVERARNRGVQALVFSEEERFRLELQRLLGQRLGEKQL